MFVCDFHIHSKYSRATSKSMDLDGISLGAKKKGLDLVGTGDFTHPKWLEELKQKLKEVENSGLYLYKDVFFMLTSEVSTVFETNGKIKKIHHVIHAPSFEIVEQINDSLSRYGDLSLDGRPTLSMRASELVEILMSISKDIVVIPAHVWTPWFSLFGSKSGFDSVEECYEDQTKHIFALETGLSSDPEMNWRLSKLDRFALVSNSDAHSPHPWRLGREANVFKLEELSYWEIFDSIKNKDPKRFLFTIEVDPNYGKYHYTGHRKCNVSLHPKESIKRGNVCPVCGKPLTIGVLQRVEELADRLEGFVPQNAIPFKRLLPLYEIISFSLGVNKLYSKEVLKIHDTLIQKFGNELNVLLKVNYEKLSEVVDKKIADSIIRVRNGELKFIPGYDGVYGVPVFEDSQDQQKEKKLKRSIQKSLFEFEGP
ncbi:MAG: DNA helicase UvrD [Candidatus Aenigmarchaeota archaeon]|nr:DNA helicase UvrD [Candidatus Aenigmarchaeota archaeon]